MCIRSKWPARNCSCQPCMILLSACYRATPQQFWIKHGLKILQRSESRRASALCRWSVCVSEIVILSLMYAVFTWNVFFLVLWIFGYVKAGNKWQPHTQRLAWQRRNNVQYMSIEGCEIRRAAKGMWKMCVLHFNAVSALCSKKNICFMFYELQCKWMKGLNCDRCVWYDVCKWRVPVHEQPTVGPSSFVSVKAFRLRHTRDVTPQLPSRGLTDVGT
jgi:hypothetical protein